MSRVIGKYRLKKDLPMLGKGVVFEHREYDPKYPDRGNPGCGCMILGWNSGDCQYYEYNGKRSAWCGDSYIMPGQLSEDTDFFEKVSPLTEKDRILQEIENLKQRVKELQ